MQRSDDFSLVDDGTLDTVIRDDGTGEEFRFSQEFVSEYRDELTGELDFEHFIRDQFTDDKWYIVNMFGKGMLATKKEGF